MGMLRKQGSSTAQLIGLKGLWEHGFVNARGEMTAMFLIRPSNLSVLSQESIAARIYGLMTVLRGMTEIDLMCMDSRENFDDLRRYYNARLSKEANPAIRSLLQADLRHLDQMQVSMATAREFLLMVRPKEKGGRELLAAMNRIGKMLEEQGFQAKAADKNDVKRILAVYFEQNVTTEEFDDFDGERWLIPDEK